MPEKINPELITQLIKDDEGYRLLMLSLQIQSIASLRLLDDKLNQILHHQLDGGQYGPLYEQQLTQYRKELFDRVEKFAIDVKIARDNLGDIDIEGFFSQPKDKEK